MSPLPIVAGSEALAYAVVRPSMDHALPSELPAGQETQVSLDIQTTDGLSRVQFAYLLRSAVRKLEMDEHHDALLKGVPCEHCAAVEQARQRRVNGL